MKNPLFIPLSLTLLLIFMQTVAAESRSALMNNKPININANDQELDLSHDTMVFTGNVVVSQDNLQLIADKVIINNMQKKEIQHIVALGSPVKFQQTINKNKKIDGQADKLIFDVNKNNIILTGHATLRHKDNIIQSQRVDYNITAQRIVAKSNPNNRIKTTLVPNQLSEIKK